MPCSDGVEGIFGIAFQQLDATWQRCSYFRGADKLSGNGFPLWPLDCCTIRYPTILRMKAPRNYTCLDPELQSKTLHLGGGRLTGLCLGTLFVRSAFVRAVGVPFA